MHFWNCILNYWSTMKISWLIFHVILIFPVTRTENFPKPRFVGPLNNVTVVAGRQAVITCTVENLGSYRVGFVRIDTKRILTIHTHVITSNLRITSSHTDSGTWNLLIENANECDSGWYMCQVNTDPMISQATHLQVVVLPDIISNQTSTDMVVREGTNITLQCAETGFNFPKIIGRKGDTKMDTSALELVQYILYDVLIPIISIVGCIGNLLSIIVLTRPDMRSPFNTLLLGLSVSDSLYLCSQFCFFGPGRDILVGIPHIPYICLIFFKTIAQTYTIYSTLGVSIERYIAITYPLKARLIFTRKTSIFIAIFILFISIILSLGILLELFENELEYIIHIYEIYCIPIIMCLLPILVLIFLNIMIYLNIRKQAKQRTSMTVIQKSEVSITKLLLCVVFVFAICYIPILVYYIWKFISGHHDFFGYIIMWGHFTQTLNSSVNFIIYIVVGQKFKETFKKNCKYTLVKLRLVRNTEPSTAPTSIELTGI